MTRTSKYIAILVTALQKTVLRSLTRTNSSDGFLSKKSLNLNDCGAGCDCYDGTGRDHTGGW